MNVDAVYQLASRQHAAISSRQLRQLGISARAQRSLVATGRLESAAPGVLVIAGSADTWYRRLRVGLLALGDAAWVSHEAAASLLGLDRSAPGAIHFTIPRGCRVVDVPGATVHTTTNVGPADATDRGCFRDGSVIETPIGCVGAVSCVSVAARRPGWGSR